MGCSQSMKDGEAARSPAPAKRPGYLEVVSQTFFLVQDFVSRVRLAADPVDVLIAPKVSEIGWLEFHRASEAINAGEKAALAALPDLMSAVQLPDADS